VISLLKSILCVLRNLVLGVLWVITEAINLLIAAVGFLAGALVDALPELPGVPDGGSPKAIAWLAWGFPVATVLAAFAAMLLAYGLFLVARIALRWVKAI